jgi:hypothetical protein
VAEDVEAPTKRIDQSRVKIERLLRSDGWTVMHTDVRGACYQREPSRLALVLVGGGTALNPAAAFDEILVTALVPVQ